MHVVFHIILLDNYFLFSGHKILLTFFFTILQNEICGVLRFSTLAILEVKRSSYPHSCLICVILPNTKGLDPLSLSSLDPAVSYF